jgi:hypothetical protein
MRGNGHGAYVSALMVGSGRIGPLALFYQCLRRRRGIALEGRWWGPPRGTVGLRGRIGGISWTSGVKMGASG